jgi:exodeoxyribonuclease-5
MKLSVDDRDLTEEQRRAIDSFTAWWREGKSTGFGKHQTFKLAGPAGAGKSTLALFALQAVGLDPLGSSVASVAYTGKAALVMRQKGLVGAKTIHSSIYIPVDDISKEVQALRAKLMALRGSLGSLTTAEEREAANEKIEKLAEDIKKTQDRSDDSVQWVLNPCGAVADSELVLCDEASMVGGKIQADLESYGIPVLYIGDLFQLPPVTDDEGDGAGSVFFDKDGLPRAVDFELKEIHRQAEGSPIVRYSRALRENRTDEIAFIGKQTGNGTLIRVPRSRLSAAHLAAAERVICGRNDTRHRVNAEVREFLKRKTPYPEVGDKIVLLKNNKDYSVVNGMTGVCTSDHRDYSEREGIITVDVELEDGRERSLPLLVPYFQHPGDKDALYEKTPGWSRAKNLHADYGYAMTCHKCQGSQLRSGVLLEEPLGKTDEMRRRWLYTGVTRFSDSVVIAS